MYLILSVRKKFKFILSINAVHRDHSKIRKLEELLLQFPVLQEKHRKNSEGVQKSEILRYVINLRPLTKK